MGCGRCKCFATPDCSAQQWAQGLNALGQICLRAGLTETVKWGHPCYTHKARNIVLPEELIEALDGEPELAEAFHKLTSGRQRSYVINLNGAEASATRKARITKFREKIISGKGAQER